ncbi:MarR family winged helix-turn-helix transcriptional regulator [Cryptosporangium aurantiacum]|uniref:Transcriptional regulator, MarR family n=1 Tax=Cryptosporangium aurantiacum TaxID=134849 RepID=A0A1M7RNW2_9ACTN|nr:MarR family winged helix-turn-helix transcriptional regulator [Cryptosporangium aurantiacum]SHN47782.1 transcriptional regulator, MarR family [Cryptosporangium aurantiacum]
MADSSAVVATAPPSTAPTSCHPDETVTELGRQLARFGRAMVRHKAQQTLSVGEAATAAYGLLFQLAERPQRAGALAEAVHADPSTVSRQVAQLVDRGLVERQPDPADGRACVLVPTSAGREAIDVLRRRRDEHLATVLCDWPADDVRQLVGLLSRFITDFESKRPPAPVDPA